MKKNRFIFILALILIGGAGLAVRIPGLGHLSGDMIDCYLPWYDSVPAGQGISVLQNYDGDYGLPYATVLWLLHYLPGEALIKIKLVSVVFEYLTALAAGLLASYFFEGVKKQIAFVAGFGITILYPALVMNGAYWGQCDGIYVGFVLLMILALFKDKPALAFVFLGFAVTSKLQTIFIIPFLILYWYRRRNFSLLYMLIVPVVVEILYIPGMLAGYSPLSPITMYMAQTTEYPQMYMHYPNLWCYFWSLADYEMFHVPVIGWVAMGLALMFSFLMLKGRDLNDKTWISVALWSSLFPVYFLPAMHERYSMIAELVAVVYAIIHIKRSWTSVFLWLTISWAVYQPMMMDRFPEQEKTAIGMMAVFMALTFFTVKDIVEDSGAEKEGSKKITGSELKILELFDRVGIRPVAAVCFMIYAYAGMKALKFAPMEVLDCVMDNLALPHTPLYVIIERIVNSLGNAMGISAVMSSAMAVSVPVKIFGIVMMAVASVLWTKAVFTTDNTVGKKLFSIGILFLPATVFYPLILGSMDGVSIILCSAAMLIRKKTGGTVSPCLLAALAVAISPAYIILVFAMGLMMNGLSALRRSALVTVICAGAALLTGFLAPLAGMSLGTSFAAFGYGFVIQGALWVPLSLILLVLILWDYRFLIPLMLFEFGVTIGYGKYVGSVKIKYHILIQMMVVCTILSVLIISYVRRHIKACSQDCNH